jgi:GTP cyclohydrolase I
MMKLTQLHVRLLAQEVAKLIDKHAFPYPIKVYAIPRGGVPAAYAVGQHLPITLVDDPAEAQVFIDDIIDSGDTYNRWKDQYPSKLFYALIDKRKTDYHGQYIVFPWEESAEGSFSDNVTRLLQYVGEDPKRGGLLETPKRVAKAWKEWCSGYGQDVGSVLKVFEDGGENYDQMVSVVNIPIYSKCEHHLADIFGTATIAYIPDGKIVGLSKLSRVADIFARRLQVQERLTNQIADALQTHLKPKGVGVVIKARHMCMESRGICQQGHHTVTTALRGAMLNEPATRAEFLNLAR